MSKAARRRVTCHVSSHVHWRESSGKLTQNGSLNVPVSSYHTEHCWVLTSPFSKGRSLTGNGPSRLWLLHVIGWACTEWRETVPCPLWQTLGGLKKTATGTRTSLNKRFNDQNNGCARALKIFVNFSASSEKQRWNVGWGSLYRKPRLNEFAGKKPKCSLYRGMINSFFGSERLL